MRCTERAYAKINLTLDVGAKRADGYHEITSVMQRISLWDTVTVERGTGCDSLLCSVPVTENVNDNLCMKALRVFFTETAMESGGVSITLEKHIPTQAGLGGGSSDAAAVLLALRALYAPRMTDMRLERLAEKLGSDVPFFIRGGTQLAIGQGEIVTPLPPLTAGWFVVVKPEESYSTAEMYRRLDEAGMAVHPDTRRMMDALQRRDLAEIFSQIGNVFEQVLPPGSEIFAIRDRLLTLGAGTACMSGSGSAVVGFFSQEEAARSSAAAMTEVPFVRCVGRG